MTYIYTETNRLECPHKYMYTQFEGYNLIKSYKIDRMSVIDRVSMGNDSESIAQMVFDSFLEPYFSSLLNQYPPNVAAKFNQLLSISKQQIIFNNNQPDNSKINEYANKLSRFSDAEPIITLELLESIIASQLMGLHQVKVKKWLDCILQRFEVTKKLYELYSEGFKKGEGSNTLILLYWLLALSLGLYYVKTKSIKYLSTLLKTCDLLCSLPDAIFFGQLSKESMKVIFLIEILSVEMLVKDKVHENDI